MTNGLIQANELEQWEKELKEQISSANGNERLILERKLQKIESIEKRIREHFTINQISSKKNKRKIYQNFCKKTPPSLRWR